MPVNYTPNRPENIFPIAGLQLGAVGAEIRKKNRDDVLIIALEEGATVAGVFTLNRFCAAPVTLCRQVLATGTPVRALLINTGCANAGTGEQGLHNAQQSCALVAQALGISVGAVLPFSTGVILEHLPMDRLSKGIQGAAELKDTDWTRAAKAIMTTDVIHKVESRQITLDNADISFTGISKGAGMIQPNMATMLGFIATDMAIAQPLLQDMLKQVVAVSFNAITVDGDISTNDSLIAIATGKSKAAPLTSKDDKRYPIILATLTELGQKLAQAIVRDGEGATKFMSIIVEEGKTHAECDRIARAIAHSPLIKTAFYASDPNLGRILAAIGYAGVTDLDTSILELYLGDTLVAEKGGRALSYQEADGQRIMKEAEITVRVKLKRGQASATIWTCDFSEEYVKINADYRS